MSISTAAIIPVRIVPSAKHRLASLLDSVARQNLVIAMLKDVLNAVEKSHEINRILIVSSEKTLLNENIPRKYEVLATKANGLNSELIDCTRLIEEQGADAAVIILADLPLLTAQVLDTLVHLGNQNSRPVVAMDWIGKGTNILYLCPPTFIDPQFGYNSLKSHMITAQNKGKPAICFTALETSLDLDNRESIMRFLQIAATNSNAQKTNTSRMLHQLMM